MQFEGKRAVVTGGGSGIGLAVTERLIRDGAEVLVVDRTAMDPPSIQVLAEARDRLRVVVGDVGREETWDGVAAAMHGGWDILVNSAGYGIKADITQTTLAAWNAIFETNVTGVFLGSRRAVEAMRERGGSIVNIASVLGQIATPDRAAYSMTKAAVIGLTRAMAVDHAPQNIRVNCVAPGTIDTPYFDKIDRDVGDPKTYRRRLADRQLLGRLGRADEIAAAVAILAGDELNFATGSVMTVDGGWSIW
ncbi:SDR family NAD(P)-dependent oxidoreductase [Sinosporangium siamense]|uniref:Short-chain dehydrogenase n=1 Tax=Sinosporangium siamense TaxID=1367973 RepID=A0A919RLS9_9ACTN|nr:SDR family oxidoreductase [Sinosporangium siamense]GII95547.1 short-chain dehydrogenase [Sinosporangium siamense]